MKKIIVSILCVIFALNCFGCKKNDSKGEVELWSTYSTMKVMQDSALNKNYEKQNKVEVYASKGESEMAQVIATSKHNVSSYEIILSDLTCGSDVFSKDNITVYNQKYIFVSTKTTKNYNEDYPTGWTPDCLLPMEKAKEYGENKIGANKNQGISLEFKIPKDTKSGLYTGNITLRYDGNEKSIPVSLNVWNFEMLPLTSQNCFLIYQSELFYGEMDASDEMYIKYYETLLENKMNAWHVPYTASGATQMAESVDKYYDYENFNSFGMPDVPIDINSGIDGGNNALIKSYLIELGNKSTKDKILFSKGYFYHTVVDEPHSFPEKQKIVTKVIDKTNEILDSVFNHFKNAGKFDNDVNFENKFKADLLNMPQLVTSPYSSDFDDSNLTYCPTIQYVDKKEERENLENYATEKNVDTWTYTCNNPTYPYPSYHIDDYLIGSRIMMWMQKYYNFNGSLYWSANQYSKVVPFSHIREKINPYDDPQRVLGPGDVANGDGYFFYPGKKYNSDTPFTSLRMKAIRDGNDDYDMLTLLQLRYDELSAFYDLEKNIQASELISNLYDSLFNGVIYNESDENFYNIRKTVGGLIENTYNNDKFIETSKVNGDSIEFTLYATNDYDMSVDGIKLPKVSCGKGAKFTYTTSLSALKLPVKVTVSSANESFEHTLIYNLKLQSATNFKANNDVSIFSLTENSIATISNEKANFVIKSVEKSSDSATRRFSPSITLNKSLFDVSLDKIDNVFFDLENTGASDIEIEIIAYGDGERSEITTLKIKAGKKEKVKLNRLYALNFSKLSISEIRLSFKNVDSQNNMLPDRTLNMGDIYYTVK